jgi:hypothetical protein
MRTFTIRKETRLIITWNLLRRWKKIIKFFVIFLAKWFCTADYFFLDIWLNFYDLKWVERDFNIYKNNKTRVRFQVFFFFFAVMLFAILFLRWTPSPQLWSLFRIPTTTTDFVYVWTKTCFEKTLLCDDDNYKN